MAIEIRENFLNNGAKPIKPVIAPDTLFEMITYRKKNQTFSKILCV